MQVRFPKLHHLHGFPRKAGTHEVGHLVLRKQAKKNNHFFFNRGGTKSAGTASKHREGPFHTGNFLGVDSFSVMFLYNFIKYIIEIIYASEQLGPTVKCSVSYKNSLQCLMDISIYLTIKSIIEYCLCKFLIQKKNAFTFHHKWVSAIS